MPSDTPVPVTEAELRQMLADAGVTSDTADAIVEMAKESGTNVRIGKMVVKLE
jgi:hypothetical protein